MILGLNSSIQTQMPLCSLLDCIEGVQAYRLGKGDASKVGIQVKNDGSLVIKLVHPTEHLAKILCHHAFSVVHENKAIQSGPFVISQLSKAELRLTKNDFYWDADNVALPSIRFLFSEDQVENTYLFNIGKVHWLADNFDASKLIENDSLVFGTQFGTEYYFFRMHNTSVWNNQSTSSPASALPWEAVRSILCSATRLYRTVQLSRDLRRRRKRH